ncbi:competence protein ComEC [Dyadobacter koreensis]|uniref:Competence protein ComEC n=1 Tax=Dyadobacter koreensis TaxID=408657 RepID=A0A1H6URY6_9BACT|nr:ComEC/Rec2 family competence protein [Dyadobacter koreensis]SEI95021.1 competence protein ComEC [Dyadobacter koreensis]
MLSRVPFVGLVLTFSTGIIFGDWIFQYPSVSHYFNTTTQTAVILMIAAVCLLFYKAGRYTASGIVLSLFLFLSGVLSLTIRVENLRSCVELINAAPYDSYEAVVRNIPEKRAKSIRVEAEIKRIRVRGRWIGADVKAYLSIPQDAAVIPSAGDRIIVNGNLERPKSPMNPEEFDYRRYLWNKGIAWTDYLQENSYQILKSAETGSVHAWSQNVSVWSDRQFRENLKDDRAYGLVKAMLLGRRDDLRTEQVDDYTMSGTVHILSVSGMHVAIIFLVLSFLLGWIKRLKGGKYLYLTAIMLFLGFYALVTGLPPSVQRATLMCIVFVVAEVFVRKHNTMNILALSALIILLFDPQALFDVGFQLSYLAMAGIFLFYKPVESLWMPGKWIWKYIWQISALSFAAQIATFPLSLYYFHQFPFYFWLINPFVITFTNALLPAALILLFVCLGPIMWLKSALGWVVYFLAFLTNISVAIPRFLPGHLIENLYFDNAEITLLYLLMFFVWYCYESREFQWLKYVAGVLVLFVFYSTLQSFEKYTGKMGMIHSIPKHSVISFKEGDKLFIYSDEAFLKDTNAYEFHVKNYGIREGVLETIFMQETNKSIPGNVGIKSIGHNKLFTWKGKTLYQGGFVETTAAINYFFITSPKYPGSLKFKASPGTIFLTSGEVTKRATKQWGAMLKASGAQLYDLQTDGALLLP